MEKKQMFSLYLLCYLLCNSSNFLSKRHMISFIHPNIKLFKLENIWSFGKN
jgi:hypothetical protein